MVIASQEKGEMAETDNPKMHLSAETSKGSYLQEQANEHG
jgi:hypothetical protein